MILYMMVVSWNSTNNYFMFLAVSLIWIILNNMKTLFKVNFFLINIMWIIMLLFFFVNIIWVFYLLFELNMIPMMLILMGWGVNMARMTASIYMILYTSFFSLPVIFIILNNLKMMMFMNFYINNHFLNLFSKMMLILMFMVKIPIFGMHYWLPKAHVEASTIGSMILASGLLKMGGLGFIKIALWSSLYLNNSWLVIGGALSSWLCCIQSDQKKLIALSSVAHMSFSTSSMMSTFYMGCSSMILYGFTHSISSSLMFFNSGLLSSYSKTRLLYYIPKLSNFGLLMLIMSIFMNLGMPPMISFMSELLSISAVFNKNYLLMLMIFIMLIMSLLFSFLYCMMCYQSNNHHQHNFNMSTILTFTIHMGSMNMWLNINLNYGISLFLKMGTSPVNFNLEKHFVFDKNMCCHILFL